MLQTVLLYAIYMYSSSAILPLFLILAMQLFGLMLAWHGF